MTIIKIRLGKQGNRGTSGTAAPETIAVAAALSSVTTVANNITAVNTVADNIVDLQDIAGSLVAIIRSIPLNVIDFGAIGDGAPHPLSDDFDTLADAQVVYPQATSLDDELDGTALRKAIAYAVANNRNTIYTPPPVAPIGYYRFNTFIDFPYVLDGRMGYLNFVGDIGSADGKVFTPHWVRTVSEAGFRAIGTSLLLTGSNKLISKINIRNITLNGGWDIFNTNADYPILEADSGYEFFWDDAVITQALGGVLFREVMDSRFNNIRLTWCGQHNGYNKDMTMTNGSPEVTVASTTGLYVGQRVYGTGVQTVRIAEIVDGITMNLSEDMTFTGTRTVTFEAKAALTIVSNDVNSSTSNNQVYEGFRIENGPGCGLRIVGQNIIDIFLDNCKIENNEYALDYLLDVNTTSGVFINRLWTFAAPDKLSKMEYAITTSGKTLTTAINNARDTFTINGAFIEQTGTKTIGSPIVTGLSDTSNMFVGQSISGFNAFNYLGTYIQSIDSGTQITVTENATASGTVPLTFYIDFDIGVFYLKQFYSGMPVIAYDTTDPRNYMFARVTHYEVETGVVQLHILNVFGDTGKSITSWKLANCHAGMARIGEGAINCRMSFIGGLPGGKPVTDYPYFHSFVHLDGIKGYQGDVMLNAGAMLLPQNSFQAMTSTSSVAVGTGAKTFTIQTGLPADYFPVDGPVYISGYTVDTAQVQMVGTVTSYNSGTGALVTNITSTVGGGTLASWKLSSRKQALHLQTGTNSEISVTETSANYGSPATMFPITALTTEFKDTVNGYTKQQYAIQTKLVDGANIAWDLDSNQSASVILGGNRTLSNPTNLKAGSTYILKVTQDGTGSRTLAYGNKYKWPGGTPPTLSTGANDIDLLMFYCDGTNMYGSIQQDFS